MEDINILIEEVENKLSELKNKLNTNFKIEQNKKYIPRTKEELEELIEDESIYLGDIDTSNITDMSYLFYRTKRENFNGIESWDTSNVTDMSYMFYEAKLANPDVSKWDVSNVEDMSYMFYDATVANPDVRNWDVSNVTDMSYMFYRALQANPDVGNWNLSNVIYYYAAFENCNIDLNHLKKNRFRFK